MKYPWSFGILKAMLIAEQLYFIDEGPVACQVGVAPVMSTDPSNAPILFVFQ